jgi:hypothetical protein
MNVAVNATVNVTMAVARFGYGYIRGWREGWVVNPREIEDVRPPLDFVTSHEPHPE